MNYELTGMALEPGQVRFAFSQVHEAVQAAETIAYHQSPAEDLPKWILEHVRIRIVHFFVRPCQILKREDFQLVMAYS